MPTTDRRRTSARRESLLGDQPGSFASARYQRITPMKARRVTQMIHGLPVDDALALLQFAPTRHFRGHAGDQKTQVKKR